MEQKTKPKLRVFQSLGKKLSIGWERTDVPMIHVFAQALPGEPFQPSNGRGGSHWPCPVCEAHGYTEEDFLQEIIEMAKSDTSVN